MVVDGRGRGGSSLPSCTTVPYPPAGMPPKRPDPAPSLFDEIVFAPDRERIPGARPVVSFSEEDEPDFLAALEAYARDRAVLQRRGHDHGAWAELDLAPSGLGDPRREELDPELARERWSAARPILLPRCVAELPAAEVEAGLGLGRELLEPQGLARWAEGLGARMPARCEPPPGFGETDERTLERLFFDSSAGPPTWLMSGRLSTFEGEDSVRLRASFGREVEDDASTDEDAHRAVSALAEAALPGALRLDLQPRLLDTLRQLTGGETFLTQHIGYWNAPGGGALMHHDAFGEADSGGQLGVAYAQLSGTTCWLALSIEDLADRLADYAEFLDEGGAEWLRKELWPERRDLDRLRARMNDRRAFLRELASPGCGQFGPLVQRGPEFTAFLADAGHGLFVRPGDVLLLPSHGLERCALHSVFCADERTTYAISAAIRRAGGDPPTATE